MQSIESEIEEIVNRETRAWDTKDVNLLLTIFHPDMVWPWPPDANAHDPIDWIFYAGRFHRERWANNWQQLFDRYELVHNKRVTRKILLSQEGDGALAVVDVDTLWRDSAGVEMHWKGRAGKVYSRVGTEWKMTMHTGLLDYSQRANGEKE